MLNITLKGTYQDPTGYQWDYYGDDVNANLFYVIPRPQFVLDNQGHPSFQIVREATNDQRNGSGYWRFDVELSVPAEVLSAISAQIPQRFPNAKSPIFDALNYNPGGMAYLNFAGGGQNLSFAATASSFGSNQASFLIQMNKTQLDTVTAAFSQSGGAFEVDYQLSVPARLPAVNAVLSFDSSLAYKYQVTQPRYNGWGDQISPRTAQGFLTQSESSKVTISWGSANPSQQLQQDVATWANDTLADLVAAEVKQAIALQGMKSDNSFDISEVSSFTNSYSQNQVIAWLIQPAAALPSFKDLGLNIADFTTTVNEQQQLMTVSVHLPFSADSENAPNIPQANDTPMLVKSVTVTVDYPTLPQASASYTFTANGSQTFSAPYDTSHGPNWNLSYYVTYSGPSTPVQGTISGIDQGEYTLALEAAGILTVVFDATQAFATESTPPTEVDIRFSYVNSDGTGELITHTLVIKKTDSPQQGSITSYVAMPINSTYNYQTTYVFAGGTTYTAPVVQDQNGFKQIIPAAAAIHATNLLIMLDNQSPSQIFDATVQVWYQQPPNVYGAPSSLPTPQSPAVFSLTPNPIDNSRYSWARATFTGLTNGNQPLIFSASIDTSDGQSDVNGQMIENDQASVMISATQRYYTLEVNPSAIDWKSASFSSVEVLVTASITSNGQATPQQQRTLTWNKGDLGNAFITYPIQQSNTVAYDWKVNYITAGQPVESKIGSNATDTIFNIPPQP